MAENVTTRFLTAADEPLLAQATLDNMNWSEQRSTEHDVHNRPEFRHYTRLVVERGDFGFVAEHADEQIAVAWAQFLPADDPGYGFLDESTPEVCLWVRGDWRGRGVGKSLLRQLQQEANDRGITRLSLSVEADNYAKHLYASEGFRQVTGREEDGVMIWAP
jgi:ribosomal protein S18 acetylase RimI-like enzyme